MEAFKADMETALAKLLKTQANLLGFHLVVGSNFSDMEAFRPGRQALGELGFSSPLQSFGLTKDEF